MAFASAATTFGPSTSRSSFSCAAAPRPRSTPPEKDGPAKNLDAVMRAWPCSRAQRLSSEGSWRIWHASSTATTLCSPYSRLSLAVTDSSGAHRPVLLPATVWSTTTAQSSASSASRHAASHASSKSARMPPPSASRATTGTTSISARPCIAGSSSPLATAAPPSGHSDEKKRPIAAFSVPLPTSPAHATTLVTRPRHASPTLPRSRLRRRLASTAATSGTDSASVPEGCSTSSASSGSTPSAASTRALTSPMSA
mmetsp:Transcript_859/g.2783  ORF Transcript_859/g.2783 Transcript_859/m.2783 type:complete len:255 (+) Transcript_859:360-1124(+)